MNKKTIDMIGKKKIFFGISIAIFIIGIICNFMFGTTLDISFTGGSIVTYSYTGEVDQAQLKDVLQTATEDNVSFTISENLMASEDGVAGVEKGYLVAVQFSGNKTIGPDVQDTMTQALNKEFPDSNF